MLISLAVLFGVIFLYKAVMGYIVSRYIAQQTSQKVTVSAAKAAYSDWQTRLQAIGTLKAINGVNVTTEIAGMVQITYFDGGESVEKGTLLVQLNADTEKAQLQALEASAELARITYERDKKQYKIRGVSKQTLDTDAANLKNLQAQVAAQAATVRKKTIKAPFSGRLGISLIDLGQYLNPGDQIASLQMLNPIYVDFYMPQQVISQVKLGDTVNVTSDTFPKKTFKGKITTINPDVETNSRNILLEATLDNPKLELLPGMFVNVETITGKPKSLLTVPQTAISYNPYGDLVYLIKKAGKDDQKKDQLNVKQIFVTLGDTRGDQVSVLSGLKEGDVIVTSGQVKLENDTPVVINNNVQISNDAAPIIKEKE